MENAGALNLTAYAVGDDNNCFVTVINKEHGAKASSANVAIALEGFEAHHAGAMFLTAADGNVTASSGVTIGGASFTNHRAWNGKWTKLTVHNGKCLVEVLPASAVVVKLSGKKQ